jgi:hypothetical protein
MSPSREHHNVYVIELSPAIIKNKKFVSQNRGLNPFLPCYYVGMTGLTPEERFQNHKNDYKSNRFVHKYGMYLVPELYEKYNPMSYEKAVKKEKELAAELRGKGHGVWQN